MVTLSGNLREPIRVLIVDDEQTIRDAYAQILSRQSVMPMHRF
jgi:DNA-binding NtrC family response regulator